MNRGSKAVLQMPYTNANSPIYGILDPFHANATSELSLRPVPTTLITFFLYSVLARITNPRQPGVTDPRQRGGRIACF